MKELFEKIYIKSESDLPKEDGTYVAHSKIYDKTGSWEMRNYENDNFPDYCKKQWLHNIDWYLQPISHPDQEAGELRSEHVKLITWVFDNWDNSMTDGNNEAVVDKYLLSRK